MLIVTMRQPFSGTYKFFFLVCLHLLHICTAVYIIACCRYMRGYALLLRDVCAFVCLDDKHKINPLPVVVAALKRHGGCNSSKDH